MASNVNFKVIAIVGVCAVAGLGILAGAYSIVAKSPSQNAARGDALMAEGKFDEAEIAYSKAVNKEQNNVEYVRKWAASLAAQTPTSIQAYTDRYRKWIGTQGKIAETLRTDLPSHQARLDVLMREARTSSGSAGQLWASVGTEADSILRRFSDTDPNRNVIRRYRGTAVLGRVTAGLDVSDAERKDAVADLEAALAHNPRDGWAMSTLTDLQNNNSVRLTRANLQEEGQKLRDETQARLRAFLAENPGDLPCRMSLFAFEAEDILNEARVGGFTQSKFQSMLAPKIDAMLAAAEQADPKTCDGLLVAGIIDRALGNGVAGTYERGLALYDKIIPAHDNDPILLISRARFQQRTGHASEAVRSYRDIVALPNRSIGTYGMMLFGVRDLAAIALVDSVLAQWEADKNAEVAELANVSDIPERQRIVERHRVVRDGHLAEARKAIADLESRPTVDDTAKVYARAKLAVATDDTAEARKLLGQYNAMTKFGHPEALALAAQVLTRQGLRGEAKQMLQRIVEMRVATPMLYRELAKLETDLRNYPSALNWVEAGLNLDPGDAQLAEMKKTLKDIIDGANSGDPLVRALNKAQDLANSTPPDFKGCMDALNEAVKLCTTEEQLAQIAVTMVRINQRDAAKKLVDDSIKKFPNSARLASLKKAVDVADPFPEMMKDIDASNASAIDKAVRKYMLIQQQPGKSKEAEEALAAAAAIDATHPIVIAARFEQHLAARAYPEAEAQAKLAGEKNLDKVEGRIYRGRLFMVQGRLIEAATLFEQATEIDTSNPLTWRMLGQCRLATRETVKGLKAIERSLQIKPEDPQAIVAHLQALIGVGQEPEALAAAREALRFGINDQAFIDTWLDLEFERGDKDKAIDRRQRLFQEDPNNLRNATALATILLRSGRVDDAAAVLTAIAGKPGAETQVALLQSAVLGARGATTDAKAAFEKVIADNVATARRRAEENKREFGPDDEAKLGLDAIYLDFARLVSNLGAQRLALDVLEGGRKYQNRESAPIDRIIGDMSFAMQDWSAARVAYLRAREIVHEDSDRLLLKRIIECYMRDTQNPNAKKEAEALLEAAGGKESKDQQILLLMAQLAEFGGDRGRAKELLNKAVQVNPQAAVGFRQRAMFNANDPALFPDAVGDIKQAVNLDPQSTESRLLLVQYLVRAGDTDGALGALNEGLSIQKGNENWRDTHVRLLMNLGRVQDAINSCGEAMQTSSNPRWPSLAGVIYQQAGNLNAACEMYKRAWDANKSPVYGKPLAEALMSKNPPDLRSAKEVIDDPNFRAETDSLSRFTRARHALLDKRKNDAINDIKAAIFMNTPENPAPDLRNTQTSALVIDEVVRVFGKPDEAVAALEQITPVEGWPDQFALNVLRYKTHIPAQKAGALSQLEQLLAKSTDDDARVAICSLVGTIAFQDGNADRAIDFYQRGLTFRPNHPELLNNVAYVLSKAKARHAEALVYAQKAADQDPNNPNILDTLGAVQFKNGESEKADTTLTRARAVTSDPATRFMPTSHLIEVKLAKNDREGADLLFRELEDLYRRDLRVQRSFSKEMDATRQMFKNLPPK